MDSPKPTGTDCRRGSPRMPQEMLRCNLGQVLELSAGGMRVLCEKLPPPEAVVEFPDYALPGKLTGNVVWSRPCEGSLREVGIRFRGLTPKMTLRLSEIGAFNRDRRIYDKDGSSTGRV